MKAFRLQRHEIIFEANTPEGRLFDLLLLLAGQPISTQACPACGAGGHDADAKDCRRCGSRL